MGLSSILALLLGVLIIIIIILALVYLKMSINEKSNKNNKKVKSQNEENNQSNLKAQTYNVQSVFDFMEFDKIEDSMIIQKKGKRYLMAIECQGINYDLMSGVEKTSVESGFIQFLNTLRYPIQLYTQTRTINLENSLQNYKKRLEDIENNLQSKENKYKQMQQTGKYSEQELGKQHVEIAKEKNLYEYGKDIIYNTERMSLNRNVLRKQYYIIVAYYSSEAGNDLLSDEEIKNLAFSELYTRCQSIIRTLSACDVESSILDSYDLVDMLYNAYNRDEAETYGLDKALKAGFDELYVTAPDVLDKKMDAIDEEIKKRALEVATKVVEDTRNEKEKQVQKKEDNLENLARDMAKMIIQENEQYLGKEVTEKAINKIEKNTKEGGDKNAIKEENKRTRRKVNQG